MNYKFKESKKSDSKCSPKSSYKKNPVDYIISKFSYVSTDPITVPDNMPKLNFENIEKYNQKNDHKSAPSFSNSSEGENHNHVDSCTHYSERELSKRERENN